MVDGEQMLTAILDPLHGTAGFARSKRNEEIFGIEFSAHAKTATDIKLKQVDGAFRQAKHLCQRAAIEEIDFGRTTDFQTSRCSIPFSDYAARLHWQSGMTMCAEFLFSRVVRGSKLGDNVADVGFVTNGDIGAILLEQDGRVPFRDSPIRNGLEGLDYQ